MTKKR